MVYKAHLALCLSPLHLPHSSHAGFPLATSTWKVILIWGLWFLLCTLPTTLFSHSASPYYSYLAKMSSFWPWPSFPKVHSFPQSIDCTQSIDFFLFSSSHLEISEMSI
jgi:hypothetical protein